MLIFCHIKLLENIYKKFYFLINCKACKIKGKYQKSTRYLSARLFDSFAYAFLLFATFPSNLVDSITEGGYPLPL